MEGRMVGPRRVGVTRQHSSAGVEVIPVVVGEIVAIRLAEYLSCRAVGWQLLVELEIAAYVT